MCEIAFEAAACSEGSARGIGGAQDDNRHRANRRQARDISEIVYQYEGEKPQIVEQIYVMAEISRNMVHSSVRSFVENDMESAAETVKMDDKVDELFLHVKERLVELIYEDKSNADTALTLMLMAKYFERIADHAVNICEWVEFLNSGKRNRY